MQEHPCAQRYYKARQEKERVGEKERGKRERLRNKKPNMGASANPGRSSSVLNRLVRHVRGKKRAELKCQAITGNRSPI